MKNHKQFGVWISICFLAPFLLAIFFWDRNVGHQYIYFTEIFKVIIMASGVYFVAKVVSDKIFAQKKWSFWVTLILSVLMLVNIGFFFTKDSFYYSIKEWNHSNYREIYQYFLVNKGANDILITRSLTNFYLQGSETPILKYGVSEKLTLDKIKEAQKKYDHIWAIYSKSTYIKGDAEDYINENFELIKTIYTNNNVQIWLWDKNNSK